MSNVNRARLEITELPNKDLDEWNQWIAIALHVMQVLNDGVLDEDTPDAKRILAQREEIVAEIERRIKPASEGWRSELLGLQTPTFQASIGAMANELLRRGWTVEGYGKTNRVEGELQREKRSVLIARALECRCLDKRGMPSKLCERPDGAW